MKIITIFFLFFCLPFISIGQITFEELESPNDFNIQNIRKSPSGEYFTQARNDLNSVYVSLDGVNWEKQPLPDLQLINQIQFFDDGTPILTGIGSSDEHLIRRDGIWYSMNLTNATGVVEASFIKGDSLFVYEDDTFGYSLDKGETFTTVFTSTTSLVDHTVNLWKFNDKFILHHTAGASDYFDVFDEQGTNLFSDQISINVDNIQFTNCGEILFAGYSDYYLFNANNFAVEENILENIYPSLTNGGQIKGQVNNYYIKIGNEILKSSDCGFNFQPFASNELIANHSGFWITPQEDILLAQQYRNHFIEQLSGTNVWEEKALDIDYAYVYGIDEAAFDRQVTGTSNFIFNKNVDDVEWVQSSVEALDLYRPQYSPDGDLYVNNGVECFYSTDNGNSFSVIAYPNFGIPGMNMGLEVLDDDVLLIINPFESSFYSLNNGVDWVEFNFPFILFGANEIEYKLVNNSIVFFAASFGFELGVLDFNVNQVVVETIGSQFLNENVFALGNDGVAYFYNQDSFTGEIGLYRYSSTIGLQFMGEFPQISNAIDLFVNSNDELIAITSNTLFKYDGVDFVEFSYSGLPNVGGKQFYLSENEHLFVTIDEHRIFRSTQPLAEKQYISGSILHDANTDCIEDSADAKLSYWNVKVENNNYLRIKTTNNLGDFNFNLPFGDYTISTQPFNGNWDLCQSSFDFTIDANNTELTQSFVAEPLVDCAALEIDFSTPRLRRCFDNYYRVRVRNTGPSVSDATSLTLELDQYFEFTSASIPVTQTGNTLTFDLGSLAVSEEIYFYVYFYLSCDAELSEEHCLTGTLVDQDICNNSISFGTYTECQENIGSFDPNDKRTFNAAGQEVMAVDKDEYIYYHIRFQNTGTDTAFTVRIEDPLSPILDISTLEMLSASHTYTYSINDGPNLVVLFENILLPDSTTNEPASNGYFKFKVKPFAEYDYGTDIPNQAAIFFDFNEPVITNESVIGIEDPTGVEETNEVLFGIVPNPVDNNISLRISDDDLNRVTVFEIRNQLGQLISARQSDLKERNFNVSELVPGLYYMVLKEEGRVVGLAKFVKM